MCGAGVDKGAGGRGARAGACGAGEGARAADNADRGARSALPGSRPFFWRRSAPRGPRLGGGDPSNPARPPLRSRLRRPAGSAYPGCLKVSATRSLASAPGSPSHPCRERRRAGPLRGASPSREAPCRPTSACARGRGAVLRERASTVRRRDPHRGAPRPLRRCAPRTTRHFVLLSGLFVPLSIFCHPPKRGKQTKEPLYFFSGLVK